MFELADRLVGIYKTHDATKSVTINPKLFANMPTSHITTSTTKEGFSGTGSSGLLIAPENSRFGTDGTKNAGSSAAYTAASKEGDESGSGGSSVYQAEPPYKHGRRAVLADTTNMI